MDDQKQKRARILKFIKNNKIKTHLSMKASKRQYSLFKKSNQSQNKKIPQVYNLHTDRALLNQKKFFQYPRQSSNQNLTLKNKFKFLLEENFKQILDVKKPLQYQQKENDYFKERKKFQIINSKGNNSIIKFKIDKQEIEKLKYRKFLKKEIKIQKFLFNLFQISNKDKKKKSLKAQQIYLSQQFQFMLCFNHQHSEKFLLKNILVLNRYIAFFMTDIKELDQINIIKNILSYSSDTLQIMLFQLNKSRTQEANIYQGNQTTQQNQDKNFQQQLKNLENVFQSNKKCNMVLFTYLKKSKVNIDNFAMLLSSIKRAQNTRPKYPIKTSREDHLKFSLFLDLDETLIHFDPYKDLNTIHLRPYVHKFLKEMSQHYELIVFTAGKKEYADWAIDYLDKDSLIKHRLYQRHTKLKDGVYLKDLQSTGRSLKHSLIIDNLKENFNLHKSNGIEIKSYEGQRGDRELLKLIPILKRVALNDQGDIAQTLQSILGNMY